MTDDAHAPTTVPTPEQLAYVWREYEYRHGLCWRAVYKVTFAVVTVAIVPYAKPEFMRAIGWWTLALPVLASFLAGLGFLFVRNELWLFAKTKLAHHDMQDRFWRHVIPDPDVQPRVQRCFKPAKAESTPFDYFVKAYVGTLFILSLLNTAFIGLSWLPRLLGP
jgi:hypothetical protein